MRREFFVLANGSEMQRSTAQMRWSVGEWIFRQMQMQILKVYWM